MRPGLGIKGSHCSLMARPGCQNGSVLRVYLTKWSRGVLGEICCNERVRMQKSKSSGAVNLWKYCCFYGMGGGATGRRQGGPGRFQGPRRLPGLLFREISVSCSQPDLVSSSKTSQRVTNQNTTVKTSSKRICLDPEL